MSEKMPDVCMPANWFFDFEAMMKDRKELSV
jgi:hypothetical protein